MAEPVRVLILGGGFGGVAVARRLERLFPGDERVEITLVDRENFSLFTPLLPEVPAGTLEPRHVVAPLRARLRRTVVRQAEVRTVDLAARTVVASHCPRCRLELLRYDHLVLALGSVTNFFGLPGIAAHALPAKSLADAVALHAHMIDKLEHADMEPDPDTRRELLTFVVAGGGFAGVETVAELNDFVRSASRYYPRVRSEEMRVVLVDAGRRILPEVSDPLSAYALGKLRSRGVEVRFDTRIERCAETRVWLSTGEEIGTCTLVWTAGITANPLVARLDLPRTGRGQVEVAETLEVRDRPGLWALGDCAAVPNRATGRPCPPTAQHAVRQGRRVAENIAAIIAGRSPEPFAYRPLGVLAGLGRRSAVAEILGLRFSGWFAWWLWRTVYLLKLPGLERKVRVALDWTLDLFFARDIVYLRPLHGERSEDRVALTGQDAGARADAPP